MANRAMRRFTVLVRCHLCGREVKARRRNGYLMVFVAIHKQRDRENECVGSRDQEMSNPPYRATGPVLIGQEK